MSRVRSTDTKPELYLRKKLFALGCRYRKYVSDIPGHPDLWFSKFNTALFVNGCFWHRHDGCRMATIPSSNVEFWDEKFARNVRRDLEVKSLLRTAKIRQLVVWECTVKKMMKSPEYEELYLQRIMDFLKSNGDYLEI